MRGRFHRPARRDGHRTLLARGMATLDAPLRVSRDGAEIRSGASRLRVCTGTGRDRVRRRTTGAVGRQEGSSHVTSRIADFTIGVEEEYQIVNPTTRELRQRAGRILPRAQEAVGDEVTNELYQSQIEIGTPVCRTLVGGQGRAGPAPSRGDRGGRARRQPDRLGRDPPVLALGRSDADPQAALLRDRRRLPATGPRADHLRLPRPRRDRRPRGRDPGDESRPALAGPDARPDRELALLAGDRHGLRQLSDRALPAVPDDGDAAPLRVPGRVRRPDRGARGHREHRGRVEDLLGHPPVVALRDARVPGLRRLHDGGRGRDGGRDLAGPGVDLPRAASARRADRAGPSRAAPGRQVARLPLRARRRADRRPCPPRRPRGAGDRGIARLRPPRPGRGRRMGRGRGARPRDPGAGQRCQTAARRLRSREPLRGRRRPDRGGDDPRDG